MWYAASAAISDRPTAVIQVVSSLKYSCCFEVICKVNNGRQTTRRGWAMYTHFNTEDSENSYWPDPHPSRSDATVRLTSTRAPMITCHTSSSSCEFIFPSKFVYCRYRETRV